MFNRCLAIFLFWALLPSLLSFPLKATSPRTVNIYVWYEEIPDDVLKEFEKETGIKISIDYYDSNDILEAKLLTGKSGYDVVMPGVYPYLQRQVPSKIYRPLDKSKLKNYSELDPLLLKKMNKADPGNVYAIPYLWGLVGFGYNPEKLQQILPTAPVDSWALFFDPKIISKIKSCGVSLLADPPEVLIPAYLYLGLDPNSTSEKDLQKVIDHLMSIRTHLKRFDSARADVDLVTGEICLAQYYLGSLVITDHRLKEHTRRAPLKFVIPKEGTILWIDSFAIPADAPHPDEAHEFIDFMLRPEIAARVTNFSFFPTAVKTSLAFLDREVRENKFIFPKEETLAKSYLTENKPLAIRRLMNRALTKIRAGR